MQKSRSKSIKKERSNIFFDFNRLATVHYQLLDSKHAPYGESFIRITKVGKKTTIFENRILTKNDRREVLIEYDRNGIKTAEIKTGTLVGGELWKSAIWLCRSQNHWNVYIKKLGKAWRREIHFESHFTIMGLGILMPFFQYRKSKRMKYFDVDGNHSGSIFTKNSSEGVNLTFKPNSKYVRPVFTGALLKRDRKGPASVQYFPMNYKLVRNFSSEEKFIPIRRLPLPIPNLGRFHDRPAGKEISVSIKSTDGIILKGTFEKPNGTLKLPIVILIHGSGAETRDSGCGYEGRDIIADPAQPFRELSRKLVKSGMEVFRYDKRGVGKSGGQWPELSREDLLNDLLSVVRYVNLRAPNRPIFLAGFSEGAVLAISAALKLKSVNGLILAGGPANRLDEIILRKTRMKMKLMKQSNQDILSEEKKLKGVFAKIRSIDQNRKGKHIDLVYEGQSFDWWAEHLRNPSPKEEAKKLKIPVLLLHGEKDLEVPVEECHVMEKTLKSTGVPTVIRRMKGLNHFFTPACVGFPGFEYDIPYEISDKVVESIARWVTQ